MHCIYILDNTLMVVRLKDFMPEWGGWDVVLAWGYFEYCFLGEKRGTHSQYFSVFLEEELVCFQDILERYSWYYSDNLIKNNIACCLRFGRLF